MSGSGPTVFGLFREKALARSAVALLQEDYDEVFLTEPLGGPLPALRETQV